MQSTTSSVKKAVHKTLLAFRYGLLDEWGFAEASLVVHKRGVVIGIHQDVPDRIDCERMAESLLELAKLCVNSL